MSDDDLIQPFEGIKDWERIFSDPRFRPERSSQELKEVQLDGFITKYDLHPFDTCSLSDCHASHGIGYVVLVKDGSIINLGHCCGASKFPEDWKQFEGKFDLGFRTFNMRQRFFENLGSLNRHLAEIQGAMEFVPSPAQLEIQLHNAIIEYPELLLRRLKDRAKSGMARVVIMERIPDDEINEEERDAPRTRERELMTISGIRAVTSHLKLSQLQSIYDEVEGYKTIDVESDIPDDDMRAVNLYLRNLPKRLAMIRAAYQDCIRFLNPLNLQNIQRYKNFI